MFSADTKLQSAQLSPPSSIMFSLFNMDTVCGCINQYCSPDRVLTYFDSPSFLSTTLHLLSIIAIPMHFFGAYCILFKTPERMISVKFSLLHLHFWTSLLDIGFSLLTTPYITVPILAGYPLGILKFTGLRYGEQAYFMIALIGVMSVAIVGIFENRYHVLSMGNPTWQKLRIPWYIVNFIFAMTFYFPVYYTIPEDQGKQLDILFTALPCLHEEVPRSELWVMSESPAWFLRVTGAEIGFIAFQIFAFYRLIAHYFKQFGTKLSERTVIMQKKLMRTLILQLVIPFLILLFPLLYCGFAAWRRYHNQALNNLSFIIISSHGLLSTIAMILMHLPYREEVLRLLGRRRIKDDGSGKNSNHFQPTAAFVQRREAILQNVLHNN